MHIVRVPPGCVFARCGCTWWIASRKGEVGVRVCTACGRVVHEPSAQDLLHCDIQIQFVTLEEWQVKYKHESKKSGKRVGYPKKPNDKSSRVGLDDTVFDNGGTVESRNQNPSEGIW